jgi:hypothetical protein
LQKFTKTHSHKNSHAPQILSIEKAHTPRQSFAKNTHFVPITLLKKLNAFIKEKICT